MLCNDKLLLKIFARALTTTFVGNFKAIFSKAQKVSDNILGLSYCLEIKRLMRQVTAWSAVRSSRTRKRASRGEREP